MKSTVDDLHAVYRQTVKLSRIHKTKLITWLTEDLSGHPAQVIRSERKKKREQKPDEDGAL